MCHDCSKHWVHICVENSKKQHHADKENVNPCHTAEPEGDDDEKDLDGLFDLTLKGYPNPCYSLDFTKKIPIK